MLNEVEVKFGEEARRLIEKAGLIKARVRNLIALVVPTGCPAPTAELNADVYDDDIIVDCTAFHKVPDERRSLCINCPFNPKRRRAAFNLPTSNDLLPPTRLSDLL